MGKDFLKIIYSWKVLLCATIFLAAFIRLWMLGDIPTGVSNDEAGYIYSSYSIWYTQKDMAGKLLPLSINLDNSFSPVYIYAGAPFVGIFGLNAFFGRLPYTIMAILTLPILYFFVLEIYKNKTVALLSAFILAVSPWHLIVSRGALDVNYALPFYLLGLYIFIKTIKSGLFVLSLPVFLLAFYSYHGTKIFFIFLVPLLLVSFYKDMIRKKKQSFVFISGSLLIVGSFIWVMMTQSVTRQQVFIWNDMYKASMAVNHERSYSSAPLEISSFFNNKPLYFLREIRENYIEALSPEYLFLYGEPSGLKRQYSFLTRGQFYIIELPLLFLGLYFIFRYKKNKLPLLFLLIAPLPAVFTNDQSYANRGIMLLPFLIILISWGIYSFFKYVNSLSLWIKRSLVALFLLFYTFLVLSAFYQYFFKFSIESSEAWFKSSRDVVELIKKEKENYENIIVADAGEMFLMQYGLYTKEDPNKIGRAWRENWPKKVNNVTFVASCISKEETDMDPFKDLSKSTLYITRDNCHNSATPSAKIVDSGEKLRTIWKVYKIK